MSKNKNIERKKKRRMNKKRYRKALVRETNKFSSNSIFPLDPAITDALKKIAKKPMANFL